MFILLVSRALAVHLDSLEKYFQDVYGTCLHMHSDIGWLLCLLEYTNCMHSLFNSIGITLLGSCFCGSSYDNDIAEKNTTSFETVQNLLSCNLRIQLSDSFISWRRIYLLVKLSQFRGIEMKSSKLSYCFSLIWLLFFSNCFVAQLTYLKSKLQYIIKARCSQIKAVKRTLMFDVH